MRDSRCHDCVDKVRQGATSLHACSRVVAFPFPSRLGLAQAYAFADKLDCAFTQKAPTPFSVGVMHDYFPSSFEFGI